LAAFGRTFFTVLYSFCTFFLGKLSDNVTRTRAVARKKKIITGNVQEKIMTEGMSMVKFFS